MVVSSQLNCHPPLLSHHSGVNGTRSRAILSCFENVLRGIIRPTVDPKAMYVSPWLKCESDRPFVGPQGPRKCKRGLSLYTLRIARTYLCYTGSFLNKQSSQFLYFPQTNLPSQKANITKLLSGCITW